jgi:hypothetical protein
VTDVPAGNQHGTSPHSGPERKARGRTGTYLKLTASVVIVVALLSAPSWLLIRNYLASPNSVGITPPFRVLAAPSNNYYGAPTVIYPMSAIRQRASDLCVTLTFLGLDPASSFATVGVLVGARQRGSRLLMGLRRHYKNATLAIQSNLGLSTVRFSVPIAALANPPYTSCGPGGPIKQATLNQHAAFRTTYSTYILGQPKAFPNDWYELDVTTSIRAGRTLPSTVLMMSREPDFSIDVHLDTGSTPRVRFTLTRPFVTEFYTYLIAAMPFLLLALLFGPYVIGRKRFERDLHPHEIIFGVAATLVAILPLRTVLVPSSLPGLTRLDIWFGLGIAGLVAAVWIYLLFASGGTEPPAHRRNRRRRAR